MTTYYSQFMSPAAAREDDLDACIAAHKLASVLRAAPFYQRASMSEGVCAAIRKLGRSLNYEAAGKELSSFGIYASDADADIDALIADYIEVATSMVEDH